MNISDNNIVLRTPAIRKEIRVFIASPSDCSRERHIIRSLSEELNEVFSLSFEVTLVPIGWENVTSSLGQPQTVIDKAIADYDVLVGVMWLRFGSPTLSGAQSGTEHEFNRAYELWQSTGKPSVMFYFNDQPPDDMGSLDIEQYQKVRAFREKLQGVALIKRYKSLIEFEKLVRLDLQRTIRDISIRMVANTLTSEPIPKATTSQISDILPPFFFHCSALPHNLIRRQDIVDLVGIIEQKYKAERSPSVISVVGIAGSGKTVSVRAALEELLQQDSKLNGVFWYSFYEAKALSADEFLSEALSYMSQGEIKINLYPSPHQRKALVWKYLQTGRYVVVLDGLEYLQLYSPSEKNHGKLQDRVMRDFLRGACQLKTSLIIVTSRIYIADLYGYRGYHNIHLGSFRKEDAWTYMRDSGVKGSDQAIDDACSVFGYHPLSLRVLTDYLVRFYNGQATAAERFKSLSIGSPVAEKLDTLFDSYWKQLNEDQQFFLSRLSALRTGATEKDFTVLVRPKTMGGSGDPRDPVFLESLAHLEDSALLEVHKRSGEKFYTAPALLRMLAYDRMSSEERKKAHLEWLRYTEGIPIPSIPKTVDGIAPVIEMIYHCLKAGLYARAWELYNRKGKYRLSRQLVDWGSHEIGIEIGSEFWRVKDSVVRVVRDQREFMTEIIAFYSTHLALSGRIATSLRILSEAPANQFDMPLCIRIRYLLLAGNYKRAAGLHKSSSNFAHSEYSVQWSEALLKYYISADPTCLANFETALENGLMLIRGYLGLLYFDYITALISLGRIEQATVEIKQMEWKVTDTGGASGLRPYIKFLKAEVNRVTENLGQAEQEYGEALNCSKELGDTFLECLTLLGQARMELTKCGRVFKLDSIDKLIELCNKSLLFCHEAGEGELQYGFMVLAGEAHAISTRISSKG